MERQSTELRRYLASYKDSLGRRFYVIFTLALLAGLAECFGILMVLPLLNSIGGGSSLGGAEQNVLYELIASLNLSSTEILLGISVAFLFKGVLLYLALSVNATLRADLLKEYKERLFELISKMSFSYFVSKDSGHFLNVINEQVNRALQAFHHLTQVGVQVITALIYIILAFIIAWRFGVMALLMGVALSYIFKRINGHVRDLSRKSATQNGELSKLVIQNLSGYEYLLSTNQERKTKAGVSNAISLLSGLQKRTWVAAALTQSIREPLAVVFIMVIVLAQVAYFNEPISPIIISIILFYRAMNSLLAMQTQWQLALEFIGSTELIFKEQKELIANSECFGQNELGEFNSEIYFREVSFGYDKDYLLIKKMSLTIKRNQAVAFVGPSGGGKSTLIKLINGLVKPNSGAIEIDSQNICDIDISSWRNQIGYVPQNPVLFDDSILNNVSMELGQEFADEKIIHDVKEACRLAYIDDFIETMPDNYQTKVGERGIKLSGGQKQRICIARELYRKTNILILDEATSALDSQSEKLIQQSLDKIRGQVTLIIIAHRLSTIKNVDLVYVVDKGQIVEKGSFNELVNTEGSQFSQLVRTQKL